MFPVSAALSDHRTGSSSLDTLLALLQAEGAKIEEETEVSVIAATKASHSQQQHISALHSVNIYAIICLNNNNAFNLKGSSRPVEVGGIFVGGEEEERVSVVDAGSGEAVNEDGGTLGGEGGGLRSFLKAGVSSTTLEPCFTEMLARSVSAWDTAPHRRARCEIILFLSPLVFPRTWPTPSWMGK